MGCIPTERGGGQVLANVRGCGEGNCRSWRGSGTAAASGEGAAAIGSVGLAGRDRKAGQQTNEPMAIDCILVTPKHADSDDDDDYYYYYKKQSKSSKS